jgi:signal peptidase I
MKSLIKFGIGTILFISLLVIIGRLLVFDIGKAANYSMIPNLIAGDIFLFRKAGRTGLLGKGDVAVCKSPEDPSKLIVGRVIGIPGDSFSLKGNHLRFGKRTLQHQYINPIIYFDRSTDEQMKYVVRIAEEKLGGVLYSVAFMDTHWGRDYQETVVPEHHFFLIGDNRNMAHDSRIFGFVPINTCIGEAVFLLWAAETNGDLKQSERTFSWIH